MRWWFNHHNTRYYSVGYSCTAHVKAGKPPPFDMTLDHDKYESIHSLSVPYCHGVVSMGDGAAALIKYAAWPLADVMMTSVNAY